MRRFGGGDGGVRGVCPGEDGGGVNHREHRRLGEKVSGGPRHGGGETAAVSCHQSLFPYLV